MYEENNRERKFKTDNTSGCKGVTDAQSRSSCLLYTLNLSVLVDCFPFASSLQQNSCSLLTSNRTLYLRVSLLNKLF